MAEIGRELTIAMSISSAAEASEQDVVFVNDAFCELTRYPRHELEGRSLRILDGKKTEKDAKMKIHNALGSGRPTTVVITSYDKTFKSARHLLRIQPVRDNAGKHCYTVGLQMEVDAPVERVMHFERLAMALPKRTGEAGVGGGANRWKMACACCLLLLLLVLALVAPLSAAVAVVVGAVGAIGVLRAGAHPAPPEHGTPGLLHRENSSNDSLSLSQVASGNGCCSPRPDSFRTTTSSFRTTSSSYADTSSSSPVPDDGSDANLEANLARLSSHLLAEGGDLTMAPSDLEVVRTLGCGSFGVVSLHRNKRTSELLVVKKVPVLQANMKETLQLTTEVRNGLKLRHPCIVRGFGAYFSVDNSTMSNMLCMAFQYAQGGTLDAAIRRQQETERGKPFAASWVVHVLSQVASAISYMHSEGVLHRDVSAANIFFASEAHREVLVGDLGLSKKLDQRASGKIGSYASKLQAGTVVGTPPYMSPELISGLPYGKSSDAWAVGIILFELLALVRPFDGTNMMNTCMLISSGMPRPAARKAMEESGHPQELCALASSKGLLNPDPAARTKLNAVLADYPLPPEFGVAPTIDIPAEDEAPQAPLAPPKLQTIRSGQLLRPDSQQRNIDRMATIPASSSDSDIEPLENSLPPGEPQAQERKCSERCSPCIVEETDSMLASASV